METIIWCLVAMVLTVFATGCIAIKALMRTVESLEDELSELEELLVSKGALSAEDALSLCERGA